MGVRAASEFHQVIERTFFVTQQDVDMKTCKTLFMILDLNGNDRVDYQEFLHFVRSHDQTQAPPDAVELTTLRKGLTGMQLQEVLGTREPQKAEPTSNELKRRELRNQNFGSSLGGIM